MGAILLSTIDEMSTRVSVVVPVYNPGPHFDDLIESFLAQSLPADQFEVLICDDGSDEATQARLDAVGAAHPHLKVKKLEHSGWPGTPRNYGIDHAAGDYIFFVDHDDRLAPQALQRLCDYADEHHSDVVVGKVVGVGRGIPRGIFRRNIPNAVLGTDPLLELLTPHKLFRTAFLREHGIRFPDGRVRLEDHMFVMRSYFAADVISILADHPCYYWVQRRDELSASAKQIEWKTYFPYLEQVLDIVEENTEPGPYRDSLIRHWYTTKVLKRVGPQMTGYEDDYREELLELLRPLVPARFGPQLDSLLPFPWRLRSALLRAERDDDLLALARLEKGMTCTVRARSIGWTAGGLLQLELDAEVRLPDGTPLEFEPNPTPQNPDRVRMRLPEPIAPDVLTDDRLDPGADLAEDSIQVYLRDKYDEADYPQPTESSGLHATALIDPRTARFGRRVTKNSELIGQVRRAGRNFSVGIRVNDEVLAAVEPRERRIGQRILKIYVKGTNRVMLSARKAPAPAPKPVVPKPARPVPTPTALSRLPAPVRRMAGRLRELVRSAGR